MSEISAPLVVSQHEEGLVNIQALFGLSVFMSFVAFGLVTQLYIRPRLRILERDDALIPLVVAHTFRLIGLSFLAPGVVSPSLPSFFAPPAAYGDFVAAILAVAATVALSRRASSRHLASVAVQRVGRKRPRICVLSSLVRSPVKPQCPAEPRSSFQRRQCHPYLSRMAWYSGFSFELSSKASQIAVIRFCAVSLLRRPHDFSTGIAVIVNP
jgi:hypothetical protein